MKLFCGVLAAGGDALESARCELAALFGPIDVVSETVPFTFTSYYEPEMGPGLLRQFVAFERLVDPDCLAGVKLQTNALEMRFTREPADGRPGRAVNLDPGLISPANLVLATGKNFAHRIYLADGIYAELTLLFRHGAISTFEWTYPDFRAPFCQTFALAARKRLLAARPPADRRSEGGRQKSADPPSAL